MKDAHDKPDSNPATVAGEIDLHPIAGSPREHNLFLRLGRAYHLASQAFEAQTGMTGARWRLLYLIGRNPGCTAKWLIQSTRVDPGSITRQLRVLCDSGLVGRWPDPTDGRVTRLALTEAGRARAAQVMAERERFVARMCAGLDAGRLAECLDALDQLSSNLGGTPAID